LKENKVKESTFSPTVKHHSRIYIFLNALINRLSFPKSPKQAILLAVRLKIIFTSRNIRVVSVCFFIVFITDQIISFDQPHIFIRTPITMTFINIFGKEII